MVFKWHSSEILENYGLSKNDKFPRRATGQLQKFYNPFKITRGVIILYRVAQKKRSQLCAVIFKKSF